MDEQSKAIADLIKDVHERLQDLEEGNRK